MQNLHPESLALAWQGLEEWARGLPEKDAEALVNHSGGTPAAGSWAKVGWKSPTAGRPFVVFLEAEPGPKRVEPGHAES